jgi:tellurite resistance protein
MSDPAAAAEYRCLRSVLAAMMIVDEHIDPDEIRVACEVYKKQSGVDLDPKALEEAAHHLKDGDVNVEETLHALSTALEFAAKERILEAALQVASADGFVLEEEDTLLATIAAALGVTEAQYRRVMDRLRGC